MIPAKDCQMQIATLLFVLIAWPVFAQQPQSSPDAPESVTDPEMTRLARAFVGEWDTTETFARNDFYPNGAERKGTARFTLATGGTSLIEEVHSDGSAGKLDFIVIIWWDKDEKSYNFFTCGNSGSNPCRLRGTAKWDGDSFLNQYELVIRGTKKKWHDTFSQIVPQSFTLVAAMESDNGTMQTMITTRYARQAPSKGKNQ
jgi:hypothetical protein